MSCSSELGILLAAQHFRMNFLCSLWMRRKEERVLAPTNNARGVSSKIGGHKSHELFWRLWGDVLMAVVEVHILPYEYI